MEGRAFQPGLLHEFELPLEVAVEAHEEQAGLLSLPGHVRAADTDDAVAVADVDLVL